MDIHGKVLTLNEVHSVSPVPTPFTEVVGFCLRGQHLVLDLRRCPLGECLDETEV